MSKKKAKKAAKRATRTAAVSKSASRATASKRTAAATIFVYDAGGQVRVRTSPQLLTCGPGFIEWTVVNLTSGAMPDVDLTWPGGSPWGGAPIPIRNGNARISLNGAKAGRFKYEVRCNGYVEDPEVEYPEN